MLRSRSANVVPAAMTNMLRQLGEPRDHVVRERITGAEELLVHAAQASRATDGSMVVSSEYLEVIVSRR